MCVYLFDGEVVDQVVVVFVEAAVQRDAVGVEEQVLRRNTGKKDAKDKSVYTLYGCSRLQELHTETRTGITFQIFCKPINLPKMQNLS